MGVEPARVKPRPERRSDEVESPAALVRDRHVPDDAAAPVQQQGWRKAKIYPDFIFSVKREEEPQRITVLETKGDQLDNFDTAYKREPLAFLTDNFSWDEFVPAGELELVMNNGETVQDVLVLMSEWKTTLSEYT